MARNDRVALACMSLYFGTHWLRWRLAPSDSSGVSWTAGGGGDCDGAWADEGAALVLLLFMTCLLLATVFPCAWQRWHTWTVVALRLACFAPALDTSTWQRELVRQPGSLLPDCVHFVAGSRAVRLFIVGAALPLDLVPHMLAQSACLAIAMAPGSTRHACSLPLMESEVAEQSIQIFHALMHLGSLGVVPPGHPAGTKQHKCAAALDFLTLWMGWLLPTYMAARAQLDAAKSRHPQWVVAVAPAAEQLELGASLSAAGSSNVVGQAGNSNGGGEGSGSRQGREPRSGSSPGMAREQLTAAADVPAASALAAYFAGPGGLFASLADDLAAELDCPGQEPAQHRCQLSTSLAAWVLEHMFLHGGPPGFGALAWSLWTALCWLGATVTALVTA